MLHHLTTEGVNESSQEIDRKSAGEIVRLIHQEDIKVAEAVGEVADAIAEAIDRIADAFRRGGRLIYLGAGTSGRLGVLDASECPPTFNSDPRLVVGLIAGGRDALTRAIEGAEDDPEGAVADLQAIGLTAADLLVGIATSGRTPYVLGGLRFAREIGATTVGVVCNAPSEMDELVDILIAPIPGPEIISGSTRMKAGTATKMVLNMLSTGAMIRFGKTYGNLMVDLRATNSKLVLRARRIVTRLTGLTEEQAETLLRQADGEVKTAIAMHHRNVDAAAARELLRLADGHLRKVIG
ncbi:MAG: N-acetylmuramic acid 6-phosphate etherase [Planctomycetaceae bacterium]|nr:MAG: N-acetylmuramic acid 6-phosphate etherase [Planctomycetaceae bacterium]